MVFLMILFFPQPILIEQNQQHLTQTRTSPVDTDKVREVEIMSEAQPAGPTATPVQCHTIEIPQHSPTHRDIAGLLNVS